MKRNGTVSPGEGDVRGQNCKPIVAVRAILTHEKYGFFSIKKYYSEYIFHYKLAIFSKSNIFRFVFIELSPH